MNKDLIKEIFNYKNKIKELEKRAGIGIAYKRKYDLLSNNFDSKVEKRVNYKINKISNEYQKSINNLNKENASLNKIIIKYDIDKRKLTKKIKVQKEELIEKEKKIKELEKEIKRLNGKLNLDSSNSGIPTSQTPIYKEKLNPNSRKATNMPPGSMGVMNWPNTARILVVDTMGLSTVWSFWNLSMTQY